MNFMESSFLIQYFRHSLDAFFVLGSLNSDCRWFVYVYHCIYIKCNDALNFHSWESKHLFLFSIVLKWMLCSVHDTDFSSGATTNIKVTEGWRTCLGWPKELENLSPYSYHYAELQCALQPLASDSPGTLIFKCVWGQLSFGICAAW